ncbi:multidrug efflux SMR transporter [Mechercharimyces sp. CAU 1602]|uniref:DMT family transporter n=1 Tax=Mechercharimyces sp. CAU 1602 TaxID=2973933 RepID=UPI0021635A84|nr:multidrug efflux SMR transporter [Mechercharimyces sp. CAU 1602]MCS1350427.1 multidrug efflux SMR transporter [Mechercharimyces sp. CAU 1602]
MVWFVLLMAGLMEVISVTLLKLSDGLKKKGMALLFALAMLMSFILLSWALQTLPLGTAYAVWTGIGAAGSILVGMLFFHESRDGWRLFFLSIVIIGVMGLKLTTSS